MSDYKIELRSRGALTQLPDSQKLFGALLYMFSDMYGNENATALTKALLDKKIHLALSNVVPSGYLPVPQDYLMDLISSNDGEEQWKEKRTAIKERSYLKPEKLKQILKAPLDCETIFPYIKLANQQQLRASIESTRYDIPELDSNLYSVPTITLQEISLDGSKSEQQRPVNNFCFYLQVEENDIDSKLVNMLKGATEEKHLVILGKRGSQGLNIFELVNIIKQDIQPVSTEKFLNLGMLLPDEINFASSTLRLFTSERRPFEMAGGWDKNFTKKYISFVAEGSIISVNAGVFEAGKSISSPFNSRRDIVFGNAFLYPLDGGVM
jgi:CRISPR type III-A-associated RAMP protein Csm4